MEVKIKNVKGTTQEDKYIVWIEGYKRLQTIPEQCPACHVIRGDLVGAHVFKVSDPAKQYIAPLCPDCNNHANEKIMTVDEKYLFPKSSVLLEWIKIVKERIDEFPVK